MASIKKKSSGGGGANWMDTYGDMVTLLLCFFVLLYSMSTIDTKKWEWIVQQFNPNSIDMEEPGPVDSGSASKGGDELPTTQVDEAMDELYQFLKSYAQNNTDASISVSQGDGYVFISFDDAVFFDGNSSQIRPEGAAILDALIPALTKAGPFIDELEVLGHTAQATPYGPNPTLADRNLSCLRASEVASYFQDRIDGESLVLLLDQHGICASTGSACTAQSLSPSHVLLAIGRSHEAATGALRLSLSEDNTQADVDEVLRIVPGLVRELRGKRVRNPLQRPL